MVLPQDPSTSHLLQPGRPAGGEVPIGLVPVILTAEICAEVLHVRVADALEQRVSRVEPCRIVSPGWRTWWRAGQVVILVRNKGLSRLDQI